MPGKHARETPFPSRQQLGHWTERLRGALWTSLNRGRVDARVLRETERERPQARVTMEHVRYDDPSLVAQVSARIQERIKQVDELLQAIGRSQPKLAAWGQP